MRAVETTTRRPVPAPSVIRFPSLIAVAAAAAAITMLIGHGFWPSPAPDAPAIAETPPQPAPAPPNEPSTALPAEEQDPLQALAHAMTQQTLLQRDARKLGHHLRQNVILFQPTTSQ